MEAQDKEDRPGDQFEKRGNETKQKKADGDLMESETPDTENDDPGPLANSNTSGPDQEAAGDEKSSNKGQGPSGEDL